MFGIESGKRFFVTVAVALFGLAAHAQTLEILPASPVAYEPVRLRFTPDQNLRVVSLPWSVRMNANRITVNVSSGAIPTLPLGAFPVEAFLGQLPAGNYEVEVVLKESEMSTTSTSLGTTQFVVGNISKNQFGFASYNAFTDLWWNPTESGWGINITIKKGQLFAAWFVYDAARRAVWLTLQGGTWVDRQCYQGQIIRTTGSPLGGILGLTDVTVGAVGTGKICFYDDNSARFTYTVDGTANEKTIYRQPF